MDFAPHWAGMCRRAQSHALNMASLLSSQAAQLIHQETTEFCELPQPQTDAEFSLRSRQNYALCAKIRSVCHAHNMASLCSPEAAELIYQEMREFCTLPQPGGNAELSLRSRQDYALQTKIRTICHANNMAGIHPSLLSPILEEAKKCCGLQITDEEFEVLNHQVHQINRAISNICFEYTSRLARGEVT